MKKFNMFKNFVYAKEKDIVILNENYERGTYKKNWKSNTITINKYGALGLLCIYEKNNDYYLSYTIGGRYSDYRLGELVKNIEFNDHEKEIILRTAIDGLDLYFKIKFNYDEFKQDIYWCLGFAHKEWWVF